MLRVATLTKVNSVTNFDVNENSTHKSMSGLQSANRLFIDAIINITDIVESMHSRISPLSKLSSKYKNDRTSGISGLVYNSIRGVTELVGKGIDIPLETISQSLAKTDSSKNEQALLAALNGVLGDHLVERESALAIPMSLRREGQCLSLDELARDLSQSQGKLVIMVHGLCMNDLQWQQPEHDHGKALARDLGHAIAYLHYNTGQHISINGKALSQQLEQFLTHARSNQGIESLDVSFVAHSMGGLVVRSALHYAESLGHSWPEYVNKAIFLGTPHHGAPLEKAGNWLDTLLGIHSYTVPLSRLTRFRSSGITDLRHGNILDSDWHARNRFDFSRDKRTPVALPSKVKCFAVATTKSSNTSKLTEQFVGDGLVPLDSALGRHEHKPFTLEFSREQQWVGRDINHMQLLGDQAVYSQLKYWLKDEQS